MSDTHLPTFRSPTLAKSFTVEVTTFGKERSSLICSIIDVWPLVGQALNQRNVWHIAVLDWRDSDTIVWETFLD